MTTDSRGKSTFIFLLSPESNLRGRYKGEILVRNAKRGISCFQVFIITQKKHISLIPILINITFVQIYSSLAIKTAQLTSTCAWDIVMASPIYRRWRIVCSILVILGHFLYISSHFFDLRRVVTFSDATSSHTTIRWMIYMHGFALSFIIIALWNWTADTWSIFVPTR